MSGRTFAILSLGGFFATLVASRIQNYPMMIAAFVLMLLPSVAVVKQNEVK